MAALACVLMMTLGACSSSASDKGSSGSQSNNSGSQGTNQPISAQWPTGTVAQKIPKYAGGGTIANVTENASSDFIMISGASKDDALAYWNQAQQAGFTNVTSKTEPSQYYEGFTYVATNGQGVSLSVTWAPGNPSTLSILAILV